VFIAHHCPFNEKRKTKMSNYSTGILVLGRNAWKRLLMRGVLIFREGHLIQGQFNGNSY